MKDKLTELAYQTWKAARAISEFQGTPEEVKCMFARADMSLKMGDVKGGLAILKKVTPGNVNYIEAKKKQA